MYCAPRAPKRTRLTLLILLLTAAVGLAMVSPAGAHGSTQSPASRVYTCRFEHRNNQMCDAAWSANSQALYDWMEVNIGDAAGRHRELIPDGRLCSAGRSKYGAFDQPGQWPVTALETDSSGLVELVYENTAPHSTEYYRVYITRVGFDGRTDSLGWSDLELAHDSGPLDRAPRQTFRAPLPNRDVPAILYIVWQRSDSPEAFYACSDVTVNGAPISQTTTTTSPPGTTSVPTPSTTGTPTSGPSTTETPTSGTPVSTTAPPAPSSSSQATSTSSTPVSPAPSTTRANPSSTSTADHADDADQTATTRADDPGPTSSITPAAAVVESSSEVDDGPGVGPVLTRSTREASDEIETSPVQLADANQPAPVGLAGLAAGSDESRSATEDESTVAILATPVAQSASSGGGRGLMLFGLAGLTSVGLLVLLLWVGLRRSDRLYPLETSIRRPSAQRPSRQRRSGR